MSSSRTRCDRIIALIDACLAEIEATSAAARQQRTELRRIGAVAINRVR